MSIDTHIKFDGVEGESQHADHKGEIAVLSWTWSANNSANLAGGGSGTGKASPGALNFTHNYDKASPVLAKKCAQGVHFATVVLTGRKSGEKYLFPLFYGETGASVFIVASKGGAPEHPGWYRNILANPAVEVQVGTRKFHARARTATGAERAALWIKSLDFWPPYADYQKKAVDREIPVVVLDPA